MFGVATGIAAYAMWERDPRNAHDHGPGNRLWDLVQRRFQGTSAPDAPPVTRTATPAAPAATAAPAAVVQSDVPAQTHALPPVPPANQLPRRLI